MPGVPTITYGVDPEGRISSSSNSNGTYAASTAYDASQRITAINYNNGDSDTYTYDANNGRPKTFTFTVGSTPKTLSGTLNFDGSGVLNSLVVVDGFNATDTQTCNYGYDSDARLASVGCNNSGSPWAQTFSYDQYGNMSKSGSSAFLPGYDTTNNRYTQSGTSYDANGDLTTDTVGNTYTWDADGKARSVNGITVYRDAFGRMVEQYNGSSYRQFLYGPRGEIGITSGQNAVRYHIGNLEFDGAGNVSITHADWLGSSRLTSSYSGRSMTFDAAYAPFGEPYAVAGTSDFNYTGKLQEIVPGLFDFPARELSPVQSRWLSPDPGVLLGNRYAYSSNPLIEIDSTGMFLDGQKHERCDDYCGDDHSMENMEAEAEVDALFKEIFGNEIAMQDYAQRWSELGSRLSFSDYVAFGFFPSPDYLGLDDSTIRVTTWGNSPSQADDAFGFGTIIGLYGQAALSIRDTLRNKMLISGSAVVGFRAVPPKELKDIQDHTQFRPSPGGGEGKYFYPTYEQAQSFGDRMYGPGNYSIVSGTFPDGAVDGPYNAATEGSFFVVPNANLPLGVPEILE